jgi:hypothetical protein
MKLVKNLFIRINYFDKLKNKSRTKRLIIRKDYNLCDIFVLYYEIIIQPTTHKVLFSGTEHASRVCKRLTEYKEYFQHPTTVLVGERI